MCKLLLSLSDSLKHSNYEREMRENGISRKYSKKSENWEIHSTLTQFPKKNLNFKLPQINYT